MSTLIGSLRVSLGLDTAQFETGAKRARQQASQTATSINKSLGTIKNVGAGFLTAIAVGALTGVIKQALEYAGSLGELAQQLGVTTKDLQVFRFAAGQVGVSNEQLETGLTKLTITLGKVAAGATAPAKAFQAIGISVADLKGKDAGQAFRMIADGLLPIKDRAQRAAIEVALFGKAGASLDNMLSGGSKSINELGAAAEKLGIILSDEQIKHADETADKLTAVKTVLQAQIAGVVADNASSILGLASSLGQLTSAIVHFLGSNPQTALAIIGALAGGRIGGLPGAAIGALGGAALGAKSQQLNNDANMDPKFRKQQFLAAKARYDETKGAAGLRFGFRAHEGAADELVKQERLAQQAIAASRRPSGSAGASVGQFLAPGGGGGRGRARSARMPRAPKDFSARYDHQFEEDQLRNEKEILGAMRDLAVSADDRAKLNLQILQIEHDEEKSKIDFNQSQGKLTAAQADKLRAQNDTVAGLKREAIARDLAAQKAQDEQMLAATSYDIKRTALQAESSLATTAAERRKIEMQLLDLAYDEQKARLEVIAANKDLSDAVREQARMQLAAMPGQRSLDQKSINQSTRGPWEQFVQGGAPDQITEQMQNLKVQGVEGVISSVVALQDGWSSMRDVALQSIKSIIAELIRMQMMKAIFSLLGSAAGGASGGSDLFAGASAGGVSAMNLTLGGGVPGFAAGGSFSVAGRHGRDRNMLSLNGLPIAKVSHGERVSVGNDNGPGGGHNFNINVTAPSTGDAAADRRTGMQHAALIRAEMNRATMKGL